MKTAPFEIGNTAVAPGTRVTLELPLPQLYTHTPMHLPVQVVHGRHPGPTLFVNAAIHGDELNGVEIIRRILARSSLQKLHGTLLAIPIVNVYGVLNHSRYLPDRRDLNRVFPGAEGGSLAARLADLFMTEIVARSNYGIDIHTGAGHRDNLPQIRANLDDSETLRLAREFGVPVMINANTRDGSLRQVAAEAGVITLLYEAGQALRFDEVPIRAGVIGVLNIMRALHMLPPLKPHKKRRAAPFVAHSSYWIRAPQSGIFYSNIRLGSRVRRGALLGHISDPFGEARSAVRVEQGGIIIGRSRLPLVHQGEALFHIARFEAADDVAEHVEAFHAAHKDVVV